MTNVTPKRTALVSVLGHNRHIRHAPLGVESEVQECDAQVGCYTLHLPQRKIPVNLMIFLFCTAFCHIPAILSAALYSI